MALSTYEPVWAAVEREGAEVHHFSPGRGNASVTVVIPAHNETATLPRCLKSLLSQDFPGVMRIIVADNGSSDGTAQLAAGWAQRFASRGHEMLVLHLEQGNKSAALNAADAAAAPQCARIYLDADVELSPTCVSEVAKAMSQGSGVLMCCPKMVVARSRAWVTRSWARVWTGLPWVSNDAIGGGFYAVSDVGRHRWGRFPDLLAEDTFVQAQFKKNERKVLADSHFLVRLPEGWSDLVRVRTRWLSGTRQLRNLAGEWGRAAFPISSRIRLLLARPALWPDLPLYVLVNSIAMWKARRRETIGTRIWERARPVVDAGPDDDAQLASLGPRD